MTANHCYILPSKYSFCGLSNQIFMFFNTLHYALQDFRPAVVLMGRFSTDIQTKKRNLSLLEVLDHRCLQQLHPHTFFVDTLRAPIAKAQFGNGGKFIDITAFLRNKDIGYLLDGSASIWSIVPQYRDPCPGQQKELVLTWETKCPPTILQENCGKLGGLLNIKHIMFPTDPQGWTALNHVLRQVRFHPSFYSLPYPRLFPYRHYAVVHLRNEKDAVKHWSARNNMNTTEFLNIVNTLYLHTIEKYVPSSCDIMILTAEPLNNMVIMQLQQKGRNILLCNKAFPKERELCAIQDLIWTTMGNVDVLIAPIKGSTFSHWLHQIVHANIKIMYDLDNIKKDPIIIQ